MRADSKHAAILEFLGQGDDVKIKEADLPIVPRLRGILLDSTFCVRSHLFNKESLVPFAVDVPNETKNMNGEQSTSKMETERESKVLTSVAWCAPHLRPELSAQSRLLLCDYDQSHYRKPTFLRRLSASVRCEPS